MRERLPVISGSEAIKAFEKIGYIAVRQRGSHVRLINDAELQCKPLTIPLHREIDKGLLRTLIRDAGITVQRFRELIK